MGTEGRHGLTFGGGGRWRRWVSCDLSFPYLCSVVLVWLTTSWVSRVSPLYIHLAWLSTSYYRSFKVEKRAELSLLALSSSPNPSHGFYRTSCRQLFQALLVACTNITLWVSRKAACSLLHILSRLADRRTFRCTKIEWRCKWMQQEDEESERFTIHFSSPFFCLRRRNFTVPTQNWISRR